MKVIVGLGNPGREYAKTRHNVGFRVLDLLAEKLGGAFDRTKFKGEYAQGSLPAQWAGSGAEAETLLLIKPQTYMNLSGETVQGFCGYFKVPLNDLLVVVDDVALPVGVLRLRRGGSAGGHNGLKDIALKLGSQEYARLRLGVGGREAGGTPAPADLAGHVLSRFSSAEETVLKEKLNTAVEASLFWAGQGIEAAMNRFNTGGEKK